MLCSSFITFHYFSLLQRAWCKLRGTGRETPHDFYTSEEARRLHKSLQTVGGSLYDPATSAYELCLDWGDVFTSRNFSIGVLGLR